MPYDYTEQYRKEKEEAERQQSEYETILEAMRNNEQLQEELKEYHEPSAEEFMKDYARNKVQVLKNGPGLRLWLEKCDLEWLNAAMEGLEQIQQKKLFDLQCLWRAEKIDLPGVDVCAQFSYWQHHIFNCPFLDAVTGDEVELYKQYLESNNYERKLGFMEQWQDYEEIKESYNSENANRNVPEWYDFNNGRTGKSVYLSLPDIRGEKEAFYWSIWRKEFHARVAEKELQSPSPVFDKRRYLVGNDDNIKWFAETFDTAETRKHMKNFKSLSVRNEQYKDAGEIANDLSVNAEVWPIQGWYNWYEGLQKCLHSYKVKKTADALPAAFDQYCIQIDLQIAFSDDDAERGQENLDMNRKCILRGRFLNGEPEDFNF
jgi:hypothetical protein